jgi:hypothetical protein
MPEGRNSNPADVFSCAIMMEKQNNISKKENLSFIIYPKEAAASPHI